MAFPLHADSERIVIRLHNYKNNIEVLWVSTNEIYLGK